MSQNGFVIGLIALALLAANAPFLLPSRWGDRPVTFAMRLCALVLAYFMVGAVGFAIESHLGKTTGQGWEFYAITAALFATFSAPGFIYRYLLRHT